MRDTWNEVGVAVLVTPDPRTNPKRVESVMDKVIVSPTREQLVALFAEATAAANGNGRSRLVDERNEYRADLVLTHPSGCSDVNGGGVANSYGYRAESSVLNYVWATDAAGNKHVRVLAARVSCSGRHVSTLMPGTRKQQEKLQDADMEFALIYADLFRFYADGPLSKKYRTDKGAWAVYADKLTDDGQAELADRIRLFCMAPATA